ncbi:MAG: SsrA-binding protein SmpB [Lentisphaerae bacterium]|nr:SsrA-binding protein SmpB [Lentisphaerota bacterium]
MTASSDSSFLKVAANRKAFHDFHVLDRIEAGIELAGTEVKSVRAGEVGMAGSYAKAERGGLVLHGLNIPPYEQGNRFNHDPVRPRRLLLHRREIEKLRAAAEEKGCALVPLAVNIRRGWVKVEIGICKGKTHGDKRETLKRRTADRETRREIASAGKRRA